MNLARARPAPERPDLGPETRILAAQEAYRHRVLVRDVASRPLPEAAAGAAAEAATEARTSTARVDPVSDAARTVAVGAAATAAAPVRDEADLTDVARTVDLVRGPARRSQRLDVRLPAHTLIGTIAAPLSHPTLQQHRRLSTRCLLKAPQASTSHHHHH